MLLRPPPTDLQSVQRAPICAVLCEANGQRLRMSQRAVESRIKNLTGISHPLAPSRVIVTHVYSGLYEQTGQSLHKRACERSDGYIVAMVKFLNDVLHERQPFYFVEHQEKHDDHAQSRLPRKPVSNHLGKW